MTSKLDSIGIVVQARMLSERLPGKMLSKVSGKPMLAYLTERLLYAFRTTPLVIATSDEVSDDPIACFCEELGLACYRGSMPNVASRFASVVKQSGFTHFLRICGDSPLLDCEIAKKAIRLFEQGSYDVVTNTLHRSYPKGQSVEVVNTASFLKAFPCMEAPEELEHVTRFFYRRASDFKIHNFVQSENLGHLQLSVDTAEDMRRFVSLVENMDRPHWEYGVEEFVAMAYPELAQKDV